MQYFPLRLNKSVDKPITTKTEGKPALEVVQVYNTNSNGVTMVRGKSYRSARQTARALGLS